MAPPIVRENARVRVQVISSLLPLNCPIHIDPFWILVKFSECPLLSDVGANVLSCLNTMGTDCHLELAIHTAPITADWNLTLLSSVDTTSSNRSMPSSHNETKDCSLLHQTILMKPKTNGCVHKVKPPKPVVKNFDLSPILQNPTNITFSNMLIMMNDCVLPSFTSSEILKDDDLITVNAVCEFASSQALRDVNDSVSLVFTSTEASDNHEKDGRDEETQQRQQQNISTLLWDDREKNDMDQGRTFTVQCMALLNSFIKNMMQSFNKDFGTELPKHTKKKSRKRSALCDTPKKSKKMRKNDEEHTYTDLAMEKEEVQPHAQKKIKSKVKISSPERQKYSTDRDTDINWNHVSDKKLKKVKGNAKLMCDKLWFEEDSLRDQTKIQGISICDEGNPENLHRGHSLDMQYEGGDLNCNSASRRGVIHEQMKKRENHSDMSKATPEDADSDKATNSGGISREEEESTTNEEGTVKGRGLSGLIQSLISQRKKEIILKADEEVCKELSAERPEGKTSNLPETESKKKRPRKRKSKKRNSLEENARAVQPLENSNKNFTLKLPENQRPQNSHVQFNYESDEEPDRLVFCTSCQVEGNDKNLSNEITLGDGAKAVKDSGQSEETMTVRTPIQSQKFSPDLMGTPIDPVTRFQRLVNQRGSRNMRRTVEKVIGEGGHVVVVNNRMKPKRQVDSSGVPYKEKLTNVSYIVERKCPVSSEAGDSNSASESGLTPNQTNTYSRSPSAIIPTEVPKNSAFSPSKIKLNSSFDSVEVTPLYMDYSRCKILCGLPQVGDIIAYKSLVLGDDYTPVVSDFQEAKVLGVDAENQSMDLELERKVVTEKRTGRFELDPEDLGDYTLDGEDETRVTMRKNEMLELRLVHHPQDQAATN